MMNKTYTLKNDYKICIRSFYNGYVSEQRWCVISPLGLFLVSFPSYKKAYDFARRQK